MQKVIDIEYTVEDYIPPRARKPRALVNQHHQETITISDVYASDAPVAFILHTTNDSDRDNPPTSLYRWYNDALWTPYQTYVINTYGRYLTTGWQTPALSEQEVFDYLPTERYWSLEKNIAKLREWESNYIYIDGVLHERKREPLFQVGVSYYGRSRHALMMLVNKYGDRYSGFDEDGWRTYFPLTKYDEAVKYANRFYDVGQDTEPPYISATVEVLLPSAIKRNPRLEHGQTDIKSKTIYVTIDELIDLARWRDDREIAETFGERAFGSNLVTDVSWKKNRYAGDEMTIEVTANTSALIEQEQVEWFDKVAKRKEFAREETN